ncbi:MAG: hypothetical protein JJE30_13670 [Desulfuromonadales bacterium]|nr:hypothetical protein [Desulfuromonadales bacterium]
MGRTITIIVVACLLMISASGLTAASEPSDIVGKWASVTRTKGGLGARYNFEESGVVSISFGALVDFDYRIEGQSIKTTLKGDKEQTDSTPFEIRGDKLILNPSDPDKRQEMTRTAVTAANAHPIVGIWSYKHYTGGMATMQYTTKGLAQLSVPFDSLSGKYKVKDQVLHIEFDGMSALERKFRLEGDRLLVLPDDKNKQEEYLRVHP